MSDHQIPSIEEMMEGRTKSQRSRSGWVGFVESDAVNFMTAHDMDKMTLEDGEGNKAKLTRLKDGGVKVECTSSTIL